MTSVAVPVQSTQTTEIYETDVYETVDDEDTEMTEAGAQEYQDRDQETAEYDDQEMYNAEVGSTIVEPPQSDAVHTHAPSTILDELEYFEEVDYEEEQDPTQKDSDDIRLVHESASYKPDTTAAHTPPAVSSSSDQIPPQFLNSPASRLHNLPTPRPATPLLSNLTATTSGDDPPEDDDWPISLLCPNGQEYILFRSDGDNEALFEDSWLKTQPLETLFSSIRQTLENELASITSSFAMDEIVLSVPDLEVSIQEDNCYTREISLQDLVNLLLGVGARNGVERGGRCRLLLTLQPRFIARFNQLVSLTSQSMENPLKAEDQQDVEQNIQEPGGLAEEEDGEQEQHVDDFHENDEHENEETHEVAQEEVYQEYEGDEHAEEPAYQEETAEIQHESVDEQNPQIPENVTADDGVESVEVSGPQEGALEQAEEDELYEENDENEESYNSGEQSQEALVNEEDVGEEVEEQEEEVALVEPFGENVHAQTYEAQGEEQEYDEVAHPAEQDEDEEHADTAHPEEGTFDQSGSKYEEENDDDDLISYEEAVDQTEDGQDFRQQYLNEELQEEHDHQNGEATNGHIPDIGNSLNGISNETLAEKPPSGRDSPTSKRPLVDDASAEEQAPPSKRARS